MSPKAEPPGKAAVKKTAARAKKPIAAHAKAGSVVLQARVEGKFAEELLQHDAAVLGLEGPSDVVREGLKLVHRRAQEQALIDSYDEYYGGQRAPLPAGVAGAESA